MLSVAVKPTFLASSQTPLSDQAKQRSDPMLLLTLLILEAQEPGTQTEDALYFRLRAAEWARLLKGRAVASEQSQENITFNRFLRLAITYQTSGEAPEPLQITAAKGPYSAKPIRQDPGLRRICLTLSHGQSCAVRTLQEQTGADLSAVIYSAGDALTTRMQADLPRRSTRARAIPLKTGD